LFLFGEKNVKIAAFAAETAKIGATNESKDKHVYRSVFKNSQPPRHATRQIIVGCCFAIKKKKQTAWILYRGTGTVGTQGI
jgi:hypothetical protein